LSTILVTACIGSLLATTGRAGDWPQFRGPNRDGISRETGLLRDWPEGGPKQLWQIELCEGYAAPAVFKDRIYINDYDEKGRRWLVRCLSLADGKPIWEYSYSRRIKTNHGITRTTPATDGKYVFTLDPKCIFHCLDATTGKEIWQKNLVREYGTIIPAWYAGQCPLIEDDRVIIATGGKAILVAFDKATGKPIWETPNPEQWPMSHSSVMPAEIGGVKQYLYCIVGKGIVGIAARDGELLWSFDWKFNQAVAPSPLHVGDGMIFMTSCYEADTVMLQVTREGDAFVAKQLFVLPYTEWNSEVHTPILFENHMFAVGKKKRGLFTCLDLNGKQIWTSEGKASFGLGSYLLADGMFFILDGDTGMLRLLDANTTEYKELAKSQVLSGHDVWAPMALANGKLLVRDMAQMICLDVSATQTAAAAP
jgi:outer membrane protein assembly factor BamB